jgi:hypothetical protein
MSSSIQRSATQPEIIAVLLPDGTPAMPSDSTDFLATGTMLMVRYADGRVALEPARREASWQGVRALGGVQHKSKPILDPISREVMGYEMEMVDMPMAS